jgi:hypothetical protein
MTEGEDNQEEITGPNDQSNEKRHSTIKIAFQQNPMCNLSFEFILYGSVQMKVID